jgi:transcriptional regulator with XRE-family HTH domain
VDYLNDPALRNIVGKKLRLLREMRGVTQVELATAIGMSSTGAISQVENGSKGMKLTSLLKAAGFLDVSPMFLLSPEEYDPVDLQLLSGVERIIRRRRKNPKSVAPHIEALLKLLSE